MKTTDSVLTARGTYSIFRSCKCKTKHYIWYEDVIGDGKFCSECGGEYKYCSTVECDKCGEKSFPPIARVKYERHSIPMFNRFCKRCGGEHIQREKSKKELAEERSLYGGRRTCRINSTQSHDTDFNSMMNDNSLLGQIKRFLYRCSQGGRR